MMKLHDKTTEAESWFPCNYSCKRLTYPSQAEPSLTKSDQAQFFSDYRLIAEQIAAVVAATKVVPIAMSLTGAALILLTSLRVAELFRAVLFRAVLVAFTVDMVVLLVDVIPGYKDQECTIKQPSNRLLSEHCVCGFKVCVYWLSIVYVVFKVKVNEKIPVYTFNMRIQVVA